MRKLRREDDLTAQGKTGEEIAAELGVTPATLHNWRRTYSGTDAAKELKELREQNARLKRLLAEAELVDDALREVAKGSSEPSCQAPRGGHAQGCVEHVGTVGVQRNWVYPLHLPHPSANPNPGRSTSAVRAVRFRAEIVAVSRVDAGLGGIAAASS